MAINDPHDKYIRKMMRYKRVSVEFLEWFLPRHLSEILDLDTLKLLDGSYIDDSFNETMSDLVFDCVYKLKEEASDIVRKSKIVILIEHQSTPERFMPIRVYNYLFNLLNVHLKNEDFVENDINVKDKGYTQVLPAIYPMVFYHGLPKNYPYSMNVLDCLANPLNIMAKMSELDVQLNRAC